MNIFETCENAARGCVATAIVALLLVMPATMRADDHKNKKSDSAQSKPAKSTAGSSSGKTSTRSGSGANTTVRSGATPVEQAQPVALFLLIRKRKRPARRR